MYSMSIKINEPVFLHQFTNESGEKLRNKEINELFSASVEILKKDLIAKDINPSIQNIFSEKNIKTIESHFQKRFPGIEINLATLLEGGFKMGDLDELIDAAAKKAAAPVLEEMKKLKEEIEKLRNKKTIPFQLFLNIKKENPELSDEEAIKIAREQVQEGEELE